MFRIRGLKKIYKKKTVLDIESFDFKNSGFYVIVGPNGGGKSTLLKALTNQIKYEGNIYFNDINIKDYKNDLLKKICYVPQFNTLFNRLDTIENLDYNNIFLNKKINYNSEHKTLNIVKHMSGGQKKNANLERFFSLDYDCLILDEPTISLDRRNKKRLIDYIKENKEKKLIICVSHDDDLIDIADEKINISNFEKSDEKFDVKNYEYKRVKELLGLKKVCTYLFENKKLLVVRFVCFTFFIVALFIVLSVESFDGTSLANSFIESNYLYANIETSDSNLPSDEYDIDDILSGDSRYNDFSIDTDEWGLYYGDDTTEYEFSDGYELIFSNEVDDVEITDYLDESWFGSQDVVGDSIKIFLSDYYDKACANLEIGSIITTDYSNYSNIDLLDCSTSEEYLKNNRGYIILPFSDFNSCIDLDYYKCLGIVLDNFEYGTFNFDLVGNDYYSLSHMGLELYWTNNSFKSETIEYYKKVCIFFMFVSVAFLVYSNIHTLRKEKKKIRNTQKLRTFSASTHYINLIALLQDLFLGIVSLIIGFILGFKILVHLNETASSSFYYSITGETYLNIVYYPVFIIVGLCALFMIYKLFMLRRK